MNGSPRGALGRTRREKPVAPSMGDGLPKRSYLVHGIVALVVACALVNVASALTPALPARIEFLRDIFSPELRAASRLTAAFAGFTLLLLARGLSRRQRMAWLLTVVVLLVSMAAHMIKGLDIEEATLSSIVILVLLYARPRFVARSDAPSMQSALYTVAVAFLFTLLYGTVGFFFLDRHFGQHFDLFGAFRQTLNLFLLGPQPPAHTRFAKWFLDSVDAIAVVSFSTALIALMRPVIPRRSATDTDRRRAERIVHAYGASNLARFALLGDKQFYFHPSGEAMIAYVVRSGAGLALGDPIGPDTLRAETIRGFIALCAMNGWKPVFYQTKEAESYETADLAAFAIGECAVMDLADFTLEGASNKELRNTLNRLERDGYRIQHHAAPQVPARIAALRAVSDEWLAGKAGSEKSFSLGAFEDGYIRASDVMTLEDADGRIVAFANFVHVPAIKQTSVDLMRHRDIVPSGAMRALLASMALAAKEQGYATFDLGLAPLAGVGEREDAAAIEKALHLVFERVTEPYNFQGLYAFKKKFHPRFEPRYLICPSALDVLPALQAVTAADASVSFWREAIAELARR